MSVALGSQLLGRYHLRTALGDDGLGPVFVAYDAKTDRSCWLRVLAEEISGHPATLHRLSRALKATAQADPEHTVRILSLSSHEDRYFVVTEDAGGMSLRQLIDERTRARKRFSPKSAYGIVAYICDALTALAEIDPSSGSNSHGLPGPHAIVVTEFGEAKLANIGLIPALVSEPSLLSRMRDYVYLAPEVRVPPRDIAEVSAASDIYTLAWVATELITGCGPEAARQVPWGSLSQPLAHLLHSCLQEDPARRLQSPEDLKTELFRTMNLEAGHHQPAQASRMHQSTARSPVSEAVYDRPTVFADERHAPPAKAKPRLTAAPKAEDHVPIEELLDRPEDEDGDRWLVHKDQLDYGPLSLARLKRGLYEGKFRATDLLVDQETGERCRIGEHRLLASFCRVLRTHQAAEGARRERLDLDRQKRHHRIIVLTTLLGFSIVAGVVALYLLHTTKPKERQQIVYRDRLVQAPTVKLKEIAIRWDSEPEDQQRQRKATQHPKHRHRDQAGNVTNLGDATEEGGDELLSQKEIQVAMQSNMGRFSPCVLQHVRRDRNLKEVKIEFGVRGDGSVTGVRVNGESGGPLTQCIANHMRSITFRSYDGPLTRAGFTMQLQY